MDDLQDAVGARVFAAVEPATQRLRASRCAAIYQEIAAELGISWAAVYLRVPREYLPTDVEVEAWKRERQQNPRRYLCRGCDRCEDCTWAEAEFEGYGDEALLAASHHAADLGGLAYEAVQHELDRRRTRSWRA